MQKLKKANKQVKGLAIPEIHTKRRAVFENRTRKLQALKRLKDALPHTPKRRSATLAAYLKNSKSPTTKILINAYMIILPEDKKEQQLTVAR